jgi:hypothetical protein
MLLATIDSNSMLNFMQVPDHHANDSICSIYCTSSLLLIATSVICEASTTGKFLLSRNHSVLWVFKFTNQTVTGASETLDFLISLG